MSDLNNDRETDLDLRSEEVQEILGRPPRWIVRWGIAVICAVVVGLFVGGYFIKYPEVIAGLITITAEAEAIKC